MAQNELLMSIKEMMHFLKPKKILFRQKGCDGICRSQDIDTMIKICTLSISLKK